MDETELSRLATNLKPLEPGIWASPVTSQSVSFPEHGHAECYELEDQSFWFRHRNRCIVQLVRKHPPHGPIFDVGGGNGFVALGLQQAGWDAILVEPGLEGTRFARRRGLSPVICSTVEDAGFASGSLPAIGVFDVVEHVEEHEAFIRRLATLLGPGGNLYLTVPAYSWLWSAEDEIAGHYRRYRLGSISRLLENCGFRIDFASYIFSILPPAIFFSRSLPSRLGRQRDANPSKIQAEHNPGAGQAAVTWLLDRELDLLRRGLSLPFGSSCMVAARRL
jgi:SAM-dependent methyltransferase